MVHKFVFKAIFVLSGILLTTNSSLTMPTSSAISTVENYDKENMWTFIYKFNSSTYDLIAESSVNISDCDVCKLLMTALKNMIDKNMTEEQSIEFVSAMCTSLGIETEEVCFYAITNMLPVLTYIYEVVEDSISISNFCQFIVGGSCIVLEDFLPVFDWNVTFPTPEPPYVPPPQPEPTSPKIRILHMSDTHFDEQYVEGTVSNCNEPLCCRVNKVSPDFDVHYGGKYGGVNGSCDIPKITLESMLQYAANNLQFDFVYWTGDIPAHDVWNQTKEGNIHMLQTTSSLVKQYFSADNTVFASVGNHESEPVNIFPVPTAYDDYNISYLYTQLDSVWSSFIPNINDHSTILKGGYYAYDVTQSFRVISLNMNYCNTMNWFLLMQGQDPTEELQWLIQQLDDAEKKNIKVHILGHIPPSDCVYVWSRNYRDILDRYKVTIAGHFYGHTHNDEFKMIYDDENTTIPISVAHIGPSVTTYIKHNPAFRIYTIDGDYMESTWQVLNYEEYWLDVNKANSDGFPTWELLCDAKSTYGMADFTANSFDDFIKRMTTDDSLFQTFYQNCNRLFTGEPCEGSCKSKKLCELKKGWKGYTDAECRN